MTILQEYSKLTPELISVLNEIVGKKNILVDEGKENYSRDEAPHARSIQPDVVVKPDSTRTVAGILKLAKENRIPVTPRGAGTGLSGGSLPVYGGITLSLEKMDHILDIDEANFCVTCESGITLANLCML
jgi:glycolate oxidase